MVTGTGAVGTAVDQALAVVNAAPAAPGQKAAAQRVASEVHRQDRRTHGQNLQRFAHVSMTIGISGCGGARAGIANRNAKVTAPAGSERWFEDVGISARERADVTREQAHLKRVDAVGKQIRSCCKAIDKIKETMRSAIGLLIGPAKAVLEIVLRLGLTKLVPFAVELVIKALEWALETMRDGNSAIERCLDGIADCVCEVAADKPANPVEYGKGNAQGPSAPASQPPAQQPPAANPPTASPQVPNPPIANPQVPVAPAPGSAAAPAVPPVAQPVPQSVAPAVQEPITTPVTTSPPTPSPSMTTSPVVPPSATQSPGGTVTVPAFSQMPAQFEVPTVSAATQPAATVSQPPLMPAAPSVAPPAVAPTQVAPALAVPMSSVPAPSVSPMSGPTPAATAYETKPPAAKTIAVGMPTAIERLCRCPVPGTSPTVDGTGITGTPRGADTQAPGGPALATQPLDAQVPPTPAPGPQPPTQEAPGQGRAVTFTLAFDFDLGEGINAALEAVSCGVEAALDAAGGKDGVVKLALGPLGQAGAAAVSGGIERLRELLHQVVSCPGAECATHASPAPEATGPAPAPAESQEQPAPQSTSPAGKGVIPPPPELAARQEPAPPPKKMEPAAHVAPPAAAPSAPPTSAAPAPAVAPPAPGPVPAPAPAPSAGGAGIKVESTQRVTAWGKRKLGEW